MAKKKSISYSQFSLWDKCPYMWKLSYVDKLSVFTDNIYTLFGTSMHEVLQEYLRVMYTKSIKEADELYLEEQLEDRLKKNFLEITKKNGGEEFCTKNDMLEFYNDGLKIIDYFKKKRNQYFSKRGYELVGIETALDYGLPKNIKFRGYIDLIIKDGISIKRPIRIKQTSCYCINNFIQRNSMFQWTELMLSIS